MEHKHHPAMIDNRKVHDNHQEGIGRVIQRKGEAGRVGQPGKMISNGHANFKHRNAGTPKSA